MGPKDKTDGSRWEEEVQDLYGGTEKEGDADEDDEDDEDAEQEDDE